MKLTAIRVLLTGLLAVIPASGRSWTDISGRKIEAELVRVDGDKVIVKFNGRQVPLPLERLSDEDREFVKNLAGNTEVTPVTGELTLCGTTLKPDGAVNTVETPLPESVLKAFSKTVVKPVNLRLSVALPSGFDPSKPQRVMWVSAAINNENERKNGNCGAMGLYAKTATQSGWVVIAADTEMGNPRLGDDIKAPKSDISVHQFAVETLATAWPGFKTWEFACCGSSGGAKASFYRVGDLLESDLNVIGLFLSACNQDMTDDAREETGFRKSGLRKIKVFISNGTKDTISTRNHAESLQKSIKSDGYGKVNLVFYDGGHGINQEEFKKGMAWLIAADDTPKR
jgi:hypothetical protein